MPETMVAVKYRLYPSAAQETVLKQMLSTCCKVYNSLIHWRRYDYEVYKTIPSYRQQQDAFPKWKEAHPELSALHSQVLQNVCKRVDLAYQAYFRRLEDYCERKAEGRLKEG